MQNLKTVVDQNKSNLNNPTKIGKMMMIVAVVKVRLMVLIIHKVYKNLNPQRKKVEIRIPNPLKINKRIVKKMIKKTLNLRLDLHYPILVLMIRHPRKKMRINHS